MHNLSLKVNTSYMKQKNSSCRRLLTISKHANKQNFNFSQNRLKILATFKLYTCNKIKRNKDKIQPKKLTAKYF